MLAFGLVPPCRCLFLAMLSREALIRWRGRMLSAASTLKVALGALFILAAVLTLSTNWLQTSDLEPFLPADDASHPSRLRTLVPVRCRLKRARWSSIGARR
jgi:hypothetical protein